MLQEVSARQTRVPGRAEVDAARGDQAAGEHADAVGTGARGACHLPHHGRHHLRLRHAPRH